MNSSSVSVDSWNATAQALSLSPALSANERKDKVAGKRKTSAANGQVQENQRAIKVDAGSEKANDGARQQEKGGREQSDKEVRDNTAEPENQKKNQTKNYKSSEIVIKSKSTSDFSVTIYSISSICLIFLPFFHITSFRPPSLSIAR